MYLIKRNMLSTTYTQAQNDTAAFMINGPELYWIKWEYLTDRHSTLHYEYDVLTRSKEMYTPTLNFVSKSF